MELLLPKVSSNRFGFHRYITRGRGQSLQAIVSQFPLQSGRTCYRAGDIKTIRTQRHIIYSTLIKFTLQHFSKVQWQLTQATSQSNTIPVPVPQPQWPQEHRSSSNLYFRLTRYELNVLPFSNKPRFLSKMHTELNAIER